MIEFYKKHKEVVLYLIFGVATTLINWVVYAVLIELFKVNMTLSNGIAWLVAVVFAFLTNKVYVFNSSSFSFKLLLKEALSFFTSRIFTGLIDIFIPEILFLLGINQAVFGIDGFVAKALTSVVVIVLNYIFSKFFVFKKKA